MTEFGSDFIVSYINRLQLIKFNRPSKKNAFREEVYTGIPKALSFAAENEDITMTVLTGVGDYFSSGNDLSQMMLASGGFESFKDVLDRKLQLTQEFVDSLIDYPKLLVAVVNGPAIGIAVTMLGLCDAVFASGNATFQTPFTSLGITAEGCSTYTFPRILGTSVASQMLCFNHKLTASEAKQRGLVSEVFNKGTQNAVIEKLAALAKLPKKSLLFTKKLVRNEELRKKLREVNRMEVKQLSERFMSEECMEAVLTFASRKKSTSKL